MCSHAPDLWNANELPPFFTLFVGSLDALFFFRFWKNKIRFLSSNRQTRSPSRCVSRSPISFVFFSPISAFRKNKFRFLADRRGLNPNQDAQSRSPFLFLPPPRSLARASSFLPHKFFGLILWTTKSSSSSSLSHRS